MPETAFEYDVAISFCHQDEPVANQLSELLKGRLRVFLYSKEQERLAGTDGEKTFNEVFGKLSRLVVVLYREGWGKTPFTRFEETAIRNRAFEDGYDFTVFIPMDEAEAEKVPAWLPKNRLYVGLQRWGIRAAAAVIESRFSELDGVVRQETIADVAARTARILELKEKRKQHLSSHEGVVAQNEAYKELQERLLADVDALRNSLSNIGISHKIDGRSNRGLVLLSGPASMLVQWNYHYANSLEGATLEVSLWNGHPPESVQNFVGEA